MSSKSTLWRNKNKERFADSVLLRKYNLTVKDKESLIQKQNNRCGICNKVLITLRPCVDHVHGSKKVRGILCIKCNAGLGLLKENPIIITNAIAWLHNKGGIT